MPGSGDIYGALMGNPPTSDEQTQALISALRGQKLVGQLGMLSGDPFAGGVGKQLDTSSDQQAENIGQQRRSALQMANQQAFQQAQISHMAAEEQQSQASLAETIRQHNLENRQKQQALGINPDSGQMDPQFSKMVDDIGQLRAPALNANATRNPRNFNVMQAVYEKYPGYDGSQWQNKQRTVDDFGSSGKSGILLKSADAGIQHLGNIDTAIDNLQNTPVSFWNSGVNWVKKEMGLSVAPTSFDAQKGIVAAEITKFIEGGGTGAGALADREQLRNDLDSSRSPAQLHDVVAKWKGLMAGQIHALGDSFQRGTYGTIPQGDAKHPFTTLSGATKDALGIDNDPFKGFSAKPVP